MFPKNHSSENEMNYKHHRRLFERVTQKPKNSSKQISKQLIQFQRDAKKGGELEK